MSLYIVRHAQKEAGDYYNPRLRHQDPPLSLQGRLAAERLAAYFAVKTLAAIYVSDYQRTRQTVESLAAQRHLTPVPDARLNEIDNGRVDSLTEAEFRQRFPAEWAAYASRCADFRFPEGETGVEAQGRHRPAAAPLI